MDRMITALFDNRSQAEQARAELVGHGLATGDVRILNKDQLQGTITSPDQVKRVSGGDRHDSDRGFWSSMKDFFMPDDDRSIYEEAIKRGGFLMTAHVNDDKAARAVDLLEKHDPVDIEKRREEMRSQGWTGDLGRERTADRERGEQVIPVVEERLAVGKREVETGGVRVRAYTVEEPVQEQVRLRDERVEIERRPVSARTEAPEALLKDREIEMRETREEPVVAKQAMVTEELVLRKDASERVETINDTVRHTEVDVDRLKGETRNTGTPETRSATGSARGMSRTDGLTR